jgi:hypothetical protein
VNSEHIRLAPLSSSFLPELSNQNSVHQESTRSREQTRFNTVDIANQTLHSSRDQRILRSAPRLYSRFPRYTRLSLKQSLKDRSKSSILAGASVASKHACCVCRFQTCPDLAYQKLIASPRLSTLLQLDQLQLCASNRAQLPLSGSR